MNISRHKRSKFGCLPGEIHKQYKIAMLETREEVQTYFHTILAAAAKVYRKEHQRRANRRFRHGMNEDIDRASQ